MSKLYNSLEWYTRVYTTRDYCIAYLFHDRRARANMSLHEQRDKLVTLSGVSYETLCWEIGDKSRS